ncbi:MAG: hypothetical protein AB8I08_22895 [Sandaracinaceae bacterium]
MPRVVALLLVALLGPVSTAAADTTAVSVVHDASLRRQTRQVRRVLRRLHLASAARVDCDPSEGAPCVQRLLVGTRADRLLIARVVWRRGGCSPIRNAHGAVRGHRMMRSPSVRLEVYRDDGTLVASEALDLGRSADDDALEDAVSRVLRQGRDPQSTSRR